MIAAQRALANWMASIENNYTNDTALSEILNKVSENTSVLELDISEFMPVRYPDTAWVQGPEMPFHYLGGMIRVEGEENPHFIYVVSSLIKMGFYVEHIDKCSLSVLKERTIIKWDGRILNPHLWRG